MSYPWQCKDCALIDPNDTKWGDWYCKAKGWYVDPGSTSCSNDFRKSKEAEKSDCYLTTAMCKVLGKEDDCEELETLRSFRDNYMKKDKNYQTMLEDYRIVGPYLSGKIMKDENKENIANVMNDFYIKSAISYINEQEYEEAVEIYLNMTLDLMDNYNIDQNVLRIDTYKQKDKIKIRK